MPLYKLRFCTRSILAIGELIVIAWIIYLIFHQQDDMSADMTNAMSILVGGLLINYAKATSFYFSDQSEKEDEKITEKKE
tara:strand:+ start:1058 stop:1297 length:240 start_codon:yes stop_codon:yes gene_type:complete